MTILYEVHNNLYINLTNQCPCSCTFCLRTTRDSMDHGEHPLWLDHEPSFEEVTDAFQEFDLSKYNEIVFCGFGEPTEKISLLIQVASYIRNHYDNPIRLNTNGLGNLIAGHSIVSELAGLIDTVSISLNHPDKDKYLSLVRSRYGELSYQAMLDFAAECTHYITNVVMTTVATTITTNEEQQCAALCKELGVTYRIRPFED